MTSYQARLGTVNYQVNPAWVKGFIVGVIDTNESTVLNANSADFVPPFAVETNMLIADDAKPFETLISLYEEGRTEEYAAMRDSLMKLCATVQVPSAMRDDMGLVQNPDALHRQVCIQGTTGQTYCGEYGVRSLVDYVMDSDKGIEPGTMEAPTPVGKFYQNFTAATDMTALERQGWRNYCPQGNLAGWQVVIAEGNNYIGTNAFKGFANGGPYEQWLVTPPLAVSELSEKTIEFVSMALTPDSGSSLEVYAMANQDPTDPNNTLTKLDAVIATAPAHGYSEWTGSGKLDISQFGPTVYVGWRYVAQQGGSGKSTTFCLDNINVGNCPEPADWTKASEFYASLGMNDEHGSDGWNYDNAEKPSHINNIWAWRNYNGAYYLNASGYVSGTNYACTSYAYSPEISLEAYKHVGLSFDHAAKFQTTIHRLARVVVREVGSTEWTEFVIPGWPAAGGWTFGTSGIIDISDFAGKKVEVGFKYASTADGADTWEIRSLSLIGIEK